MLFKTACKVLVLSCRKQSTNVTRPKVISPFQEASLNEKCIMVDEQDNVIGPASKLNCHLIQNDGSLILHRAFSVFLFNSKGEMLLQQRSHNKVTFPSHVSNACCSHPLYEIEEERNENEAVGVKIAAQRRLNVELGISMDQTSLSDYHYITRVLYRFDDKVKWGEHELDYILFLKKDIKIQPNPEEVSSVEFVSQRNFDSYVKNLKYPLSPWFQLFTKNFLHKWWSQLDNLDKIKDHKTIHKMM